MPPLLADISWTRFKLWEWISNYTHIKPGDMITRPGPNVNGGLSKPPSTLRALVSNFINVQYRDVILSVNASEITSIKIIYWNVYSGADQRKHQSSAPLAFVREIHRWQLNSPHKEPVTRKMFLFDDVSMQTADGIPYLCLNISLYLLLISRNDFPYRQQNRNVILTKIFGRKLPI